MEISGAIQFANDGDHVFVGDFEGLQPIQEIIELLLFLTRAEARERGGVDGRAGDFYLRLLCEMITGLICTSP